MPVAAKQSASLKDVLSAPVFARVDAEARRTGKSHERVIDEAVKASIEKNLADKRLYCVKCRAFKPHTFAMIKKLPGTREEEQIYSCMECKHQRRYGTEVPLTL